MATFLNRPLLRSMGRRRFFATAGATAAGVAAVSSGLALLTRSGDVAPVAASSHREAPLISSDPVADNTDVYAFVSPDAPSTVTFVACFIPFESPDGGPNYFQFGDDVLYQIYVDNNGDSKPEITWQFTFKTTVQNPGTFLYNTGPISSLTDPNWNVRQTMTVTQVDAKGSTVLGSNLPTPPVNIGPKSTPSYDALANAAISALSNGAKVFAGQRADPFFVDLGSVFDLLTIRKLPGNAGGGVNALAGYNVHAIVLQVPISAITANGSTPTDPKDPNAVIGTWSTASRKTASVLSAGAAPSESGNWVQISRLGMPLVNEVVIPLGKKDLWNGSKPSDDAQFLSYVTDPEPARLLKALYNIQVPPTPRDDLVAIFLTGIKGLNMPANVTPCEQLRLNVAIPPSASPNRMGVLGGDLQGYPNGRRLLDDVTDISLNAVAGAAYPLFHQGFTPDPLAGKLGDGVDGPDKPYLTSFPYVASPYRGYEYSAGVAVAGGAAAAPSAGAAPSGAPAELGKSATGTLTGSSGGAFASYQISKPSGSPITLTLGFNAPGYNLLAGIGLQVYQNGGSLGSVSGSPNTPAQVQLVITPAATSPVLVKVFNYNNGVAVPYTLSQS